MYATNDASDGLELYRSQITNNSGARRRKDECQNMIFFWFTIIHLPSIDAMVIVLYSYASLDCITVFFLTISIAVYCLMFILLLE